MQREKLRRHAHFDQPIVLQHDHHLVELLQLEAHPPGQVVIFETGSVPARHYCFSGLIRHKRSFSQQYLHRVPDQLVHYDSVLWLVEGPQNMLHQKTKCFLVLFWELR